jgi:hypothetical protein|eukprot:scaffold529_cov196-Alexandrium_tamarense.AAC.54
MKTTAFLIAAIASTANAFTSSPVFNVRKTSSLSMNASERTYIMVRRRASLLFFVVVGVVSSEELVDV